MNLLSMHVLHIQLIPIFLLFLPTSTLKSDWTVELESRLSVLEEDIPNEVARPLFLPEPCLLCFLLLWMLSVLHMLFPIKWKILIVSIFQLLNSSLGRDIWQWNYSWNNLLIIHSIKTETFENNLQSNQVIHLLEL